MEKEKLSKVNVMFVKGKELKMIWRLFRSKLRRVRNMGKR